MNRFQVGEVVGRTKLRNTFDYEVVQVLHSYLSEQRDEKAKGRKYRVVKELPTADEYKELKKQYFTTNVGDLISNAYSEVESLQSEMDEWYNNLTDGLQQTDLGQRVEEAANALSEYTSEPDVRETFAAIKTIYVPSSKVGSRADRCAEAVGMLRTASEALANFKAANSDRVVIMEGELSNDREEVFLSEVDELMDELDTAVDNIEGVDFPGMYG